MLLVMLPGCQSCRRFVDAMRASSSGINDVRVVDARALTPEQRVGIDVVPTLILDDGRRMGGTAAFQWLEGRGQPGALTAEGSIGYTNVGGGSDYCELSYCKL